MPGVPTVDALEFHAQAEPSGVALVVPGRSKLTWAEWLARVRATAAGMLHLGVGGHGGHVGLSFARDEWTDFAVAYLACHAAGRVPVLLDSSMGPLELGGVQQTARLEAIVSVRTLAGRANCPVALLSDLGKRPAVSARDAVLPPTRFADILSTSGTMGRPTLICTPWDALAFGGATSVWRGRRRLHCALPSSFAGVHGMLLYGLQGGVTDIVAPTSAPEHFVELISMLAPSWIAGVPEFLRFVVDRMARTGIVDHRTRIVSVFGSYADAGLLAQVRARFPSAAVVNVYGASEAGAAVTMMLYDQRRPLSVGRPNAPTEVRIESGGKDAGPDAEGQILLRRRGAASRMLLHREGLSPLDREGWVCTGDLGYLDQEGYLYITGREGDFVNTGGIKIATTFVETAIRSHPQVRNAAVVGEPDAVEGERLVAFVCGDEGLSAQALRAFLASQLSRHQVPRAIRLVADIPLTVHGKPDKLALREGRHVQ